jgi:putative transposase
MKVGEICRKHGEPKYYRWKAKYGGLEVSEARRLRPAAAGKTKIGG